MISFIIYYAITILILSPNYRLCETLTVRHKIESNLL